MNIYSSGVNKSFKNKKELQEYIAYLQDSVHACRKISEDPEATRKERVKAREKARAYDKEVVRLKSLLITL